jgi:hypothetical protein
MLGISIVIILLSALSIAVGITGSSLLLVIFGIVLLMYLILIRVRLKVVITPSSLEYTGIFSTRKILLSDIQIAKCVADTGYIASRFSGPFTYEFRTSSEIVRINLKLFPVELSHKLFKIVDVS